MTSLILAVPDYYFIFFGGLIQPKVEGVVAFVTARTPEPGRLTSAELLGTVAHALPTIEIADSRIADWELAIVDTIPDNASFGRFVLGTRLASLSELDLRLCGMVLERMENLFRSERRRRASAICFRLLVGWQPNLPTGLTSCSGRHRAFRRVGAHGVGGSRRSPRCTDQRTWMRLGQIFRLTASG